MGLHVEMPAAVIPAGPPAARSAMRSKSEQPQRRNVQFAFGTILKTAAEKEVGVARQLAGTQTHEEVITAGRILAEVSVKLQRDSNGRARSLSRCREPAEAVAATGDTNLEDNGPARYRGQGLFLSALASNFRYSKSSGRRQRHAKDSLLFK